MVLTTLFKVTNPTEEHIKYKNMIGMTSILSYENLDENTVELLFIGSCDCYERNTFSYTELEALN